MRKANEALNERELALVNLCADRCCIWDDDEDKRCQMAERSEAIIRAGEILGAETIRIDAGGRDDEYSSEQFDYIVSRYKTWAARAADRGYRIGPENHWGTEVKPAIMRNLSQTVDHPGYGVLVHFKHPEDTQFMDWAMHTHISWDLVNANLEETLETLYRTGYSGAWSAEHHSGEDEYDEVGIQLASIRRAVRRVTGRAKSNKQSRATKGPAE